MKVQNLRIKSLRDNNTLGNSEYSFLYDTKATIGTTVNGMLTLTMMVDMLESNLSHFYPLQFNTDGLTFIIKRSELDLAISLFDKLTEIDDIPYEYVEYTKMVIKDVNNYLAIDTYNNIKTKNIFQDYDDLLKSGEYHKDFSALVIPKALKKFFIEGIPIEDTINEENNIHEFCYGNNGSKLYKWMLTEYHPDKGVATSELFDGRFIRYYAGGFQTISQLWTGGKRVGTIQAVQAQTPVTLLMNVPKIDIYDYKKGERIIKEKERYPNLNRQWYIDECYKIINQIVKYETI